MTEGSARSASPRSRSARRASWAAAAARARAAAGDSTTAPVSAVDHQRLASARRQQQLRAEPDHQRDPEPARDDRGVRGRPAGRRARSRRPPGPSSATSAGPRSLGDEDAPAARRGRSRRSLARRAASRRARRPSERTSSARAARVSSSSAAIAAAWRLAGRRRARRGAGRPSSTAASSVATSAGSAAISTPVATMSPPRRRAQPRGERLELRGRGAQARRGRARPAPGAARCGTVSAATAAPPSTRAQPIARPGEAGQPAQDPLDHQPGVTRARPSAADDQRRRGRARVLMADRALAEVRRAALARLHRHGGARALVRGVGRRGERVAASASPASSRSRSAATAGPSASTIVLSPGSAAPSSDHARERRVERADQRGPVERRRVADRAARAAERGAPQRAARAADGRDERLAGQDQPLAGAGSSASARAASTARIPRVMLIPWSPSPIAESSCVRWSASASTAAADLGHPGVD